MSGWRIGDGRGRTDRWSTSDMREKLEREGEYSLARKIERRSCLSDSEYRRARQALESGFRRSFVERYDFRKVECEDDE